MARSRASFSKHLISLLLWFLTLPWGIAGVTVPEQQDLAATGLPHVMCFTQGIPIQPIQLKPYLRHYSAARRVLITGTQLRLVNFAIRVLIQHGQHRFGYP
jgi:hypothetical protein